MKLKAMPCATFSRAKCIFRGKKYIAVCTGGQVLVCDNSLSILTKIKNLSYAYHAYFSPDETTLVVLSNTKFIHILDLNDFSLSRRRIEDSYFSDITGCWSFDGKKFYTIANSFEAVDSTFREYESSFREPPRMLSREKYHFSAIIPVTEEQKYLLIGLHQELSDANSPTPYFLVWFDGERFEEFPMEESHRILVITRVTVDPHRKRLTVYDYNKVLHYSFSGERIDSLATIDFEEAVDKLTAKELEAYKTTLASSRRLPPPIGTIHKLLHSKYDEKVFIATDQGLLIFDATTKALLVNKRIAFGVRDVVELSADEVLVETYSGFKLFEIIY